MYLKEHLIMFAYSLPSNSGNAKELLQETNLKALSYRDRFICETNFKAWTFTIMRNTFINDYRRKVHFNVINGKDGIVIKKKESGMAHDPASILDFIEHEK